MYIIKTVTFVADQRGSGEDLYRCKEDGKIYIRQECDEEYVRWLTASKCGGGYEADCPLKEGLVMNVVNKNGLLILSEYIIIVDGYTSTVAEKIAPFSWEPIKALSNEMARKYKLRSYEEWKSWLMAEAKAAGFTEDKDVWMYHHVKYGDSKEIALLDDLGMMVYATVTEATHTICGKRWMCYEIRSEDLLTVKDICGYMF